MILLYQLHPNEGADNPQEPARWLQYAPKAVYVRPKGADIGDLFGTDAPQGCMPVLHKSTTFTIDLPKIDETFKVARTAIPLDLFYAQTEYAVQGANLSGLDRTWLLHLNPPADKQPLRRASLFVMLTRFKRLQDIRLLRPLWSDMEERTHVIDYYMHSLKMEPGLEDEILRLKTLANATERMDASVQAPQHG